MMAKMLKKPVDFRGPNFKIVENPRGVKLFHDTGIGSFLPWKPGDGLVVARQEKVYRGQLDDITSVHGSVAVSRRFRDLVESFEPGIHAFAPIALERSNGEPFDEYFLFATQQDIDCIITDNDPENFEYLWTDPKDGEKRILCILTRPGKTVPLSRPAIVGKHLWTAGLLGLTEMFVSDEYHAAFLKHCSGRLSDSLTKVDVIDRPWVAEEQMGPLLPRHLAYIASGRSKVDWTLGEIWK